MTKFPRFHKRVVILGAGADLALGCASTSDLTNLIKKQIPEELQSSLNSFIKSRDCNFETYISAIEQITNYLIAKETSGHISVKNTNIIPAIFDLNETLPKQNVEDWFSIYKNCLNLVIE